MAIRLIYQVHERRPDHGGCPFKQIIDATPEELKVRPGGMYDELAVELCGGEHMRVSLRLLLATLEGSGAKATRWQGRAVGGPGRGVVRGKTHRESSPEALDVHNRPTDNTHDGKIMPAAVRLPHPPSRSGGLQNV